MREALKTGGALCDGGGRYADPDTHCPASCAISLRGMATWCKSRDANASDICSTRKKLDRELSDPVLFPGVHNCGCSSVQARHVEWELPIADHSRGLEIGK